MTRRKKGKIGESKVLCELIEQDYDIYLPYSDGTPFDLIASKDNKLYRVSIKYTSFFDKGAWVVGLRNVSRRNNGEVCVKKFDKNSCDILAVYIQPENRIVLIESKNISATCSLAVAPLTRKGRLF